MNINQLFFELIQVALGTRVCLSHSPTGEEWKVLYEMAKKQSLVGVCFAGVQQLQQQRQCPPEMLYLTWMGMAAKIQQRNETVNRQCVELQKRLSAEGVKSSILKGQGIANLYYESLRGLRQSGDIDVLADCDFVRAASFAKSSTGINVKWAYKEISLPIVQDTEVELHIKPGLMFNPIHNRTW